MLSLSTLVSTSLMTESLMPLCGLAHAFSASSLIIFCHFPRYSLGISLLFSSSSFSYSFEQSSWCGRPMLLGGRKGSKATYPSLLYAAKGQHSISVLSFCLDELLLGRLHPNQIKRVHEFVQIILLFYSSTPNQPSSSLVLPQIRL